MGSAVRYRLLLQRGWPRANATGTAPFDDPIPLPDRRVLRSTMRALRESGGGLGRKSQQARSRVARPQLLTSSRSWRLVAERSCFGLPH